MEESWAELHIIVEHFVSKVLAFVQMLCLLSHQNFKRLH
jgi:hypothetical protein